MNRLLLTFYGDDFSGSTDALEQLSRHGIRTMLFMRPPTPAQLRRFSNLQAVGVAGRTRAMTPAAMERELRPALKQLKALGAPHVHYKVCSTFDSSPQIGSIGRAIDIGTGIFPAPFVPLLAAAPELGRHCVFGNLFARFGIGSCGGIHRLDRHPSISHHPVTPMTEADLRQHLARQTDKKVALFDILQLALPEPKARAALEALLRDRPDVVLFDALYPEHLPLIGSLIDGYASARRPLFSVGSSGIESALAAHWTRGKKPGRARRADRVDSVLVGSGSCAAVNSEQIDWALKQGFAEVPLDAAAIASRQNRAGAIQRAIRAASEALKAGRSVIVHTSRSGSDRRVAATLKNQASEILGTALGQVLRGALERARVPRLCLAGGDTSGFAARALGIDALEWLGPLTPGAPLCRAHAPGSRADGLQIVFKGGQVGARDYFERLKRGSI